MLEQETKPERGANERVSSEREERKGQQEKEEERRKRRERGGRSRTRELFNNTAREREAKSSGAQVLSPQVCGPLEKEREPRPSNAHTHARTHTHLKVASIDLRGIFLSLSLFLE